MTLRMTSIVKFHYIRLGYRSLLLLTYAGLYLYTKVRGGGDVWDARGEYPLFFGLLWIVFLLEMAHRLFPSRLESPGCQKQFAKNYVAAGHPETGNCGEMVGAHLGAENRGEVLEARPGAANRGEMVEAHPGAANHGVMFAAFSWIGLNAFFGALYLAGIVDDGFMLLLSLAYSVCDLICVLFFCPFQSWMLKNKCCATCRIYNWDYAMMCTPLLFVRTPYTWSLLFLSLLILFRWELTFFLHPQRFFEKTNAYLRCENCREKLCVHKAQRNRWLGNVLRFPFSFR